MDPGADGVRGGGSNTPAAAAGGKVPLLVPSQGNDHLRIDIPPLRERLLHRSSGGGGGVLGWFVAPLAVLRRAVDRRERISLSVPSLAAVRRRLLSRIRRKIDWASLTKACKEWLKHPMNVALLLWLVPVAVFLSLLFLLLTELVDGAFPDKARRKRWIEICNQVLNALFTLMSLYEHPNLCHHLVLLFRWRPADIVELRKVYCKNGAYRPREWAHTMVVVFLLQLTCFAQYALCALYWGYRGADRPEVVENFLAVIGVVAPVLAGVYTVYSPLGRECDPDPSEEGSQGSPSIGPAAAGAEPVLRLRDRRAAVARPEWAGGVFDLGDDLPVAFLSFFCTCCVFGWNMGRLGFGNGYVHAATFVLLFIAPYWVFGISADNIQNAVLRHAVRTTGLVLSLLCFLYGGFWRTQIRRRFRLPENTLCGRRGGSAADYLQWLFCWGCSLAQEVRTGNLYDVEEDSLYYRKHGAGGAPEGGDGRASATAAAAGGVEDGPVLQAPESDIHSRLTTSRDDVSLPSPRRVEDRGRAVGGDRDEGSSSSSPRTADGGAMVAPAPLLMEIEDGDSSL